MITITTARVKRITRTTKLSSPMAGARCMAGGGITPDVKLAPYKSNKFQDSLLQHYALFNFAKHYAITHKITQNFEVDDAVLLDFRKFLDGEKIAYTEAEMIESNDWLRSNIKSELFVDTFGQEEGLKGAGRNRPGCDQGFGSDAAGAGAGGQCQEGGCGTQFGGSGDSLNLLNHRL